MSNFQESVRDSELSLGNIGRCITHWAYVEEKLFDVCALSLKSPRKQAAIVYYRTPSLESRLALVEELVLALLPQNKSGEHSPPAVLDWDAIAKEIRKLLSERNAMAHFPLKSIFVQVNGKRDGVTKETCFLRPAHDETLRGRKLKIERLKPEALPKHLARLNSLELDLAKFKSTLRTAMS